MSNNKDQRAVAFLQGAFFPSIPNFRQQLLELGETALLEPPPKGQQDSKVSDHPVPEHLN